MHQRLLVAILIPFLAAPVALAEDEDPYLWLEEVEGEKALAWAKEQSAATAAEFEAVPEFAELHEERQTALILRVYGLHWLGEAVHKTVPGHSPHGRTTA